MDGNEEQKRLPEQPTSEQSSAEQPSSEQPIKPANESPLWIVIWIGFGFLLALAILGGKDNVKNLSNAKVQEVLTLFQKKYIEEIDPDKFIDDLLHGGIAKASDPNSYYLNKKEAERDNVKISGKFAGIGVGLLFKKDIQTQSYMTIVASVFEGPAKKAGLKTGDVIAAVSSTAKDADRVLTADLPLLDVIDLIRGKKGTKVKLWILREEKIKEFVLVRGIIKIETVSSKKIKDGIGYVKITKFAMSTNLDFRKAVDQLKANGTKSLIIDVRNNPGGVLFVVKAILNAFRADLSTPFVYTKERNGEYKLHSISKTLEYLKRKFPNLKINPNSYTNSYTDLKVVVLINGYSASASEILAGWLKEELGVPVIGEKSFGKGSVQANFKLKDGTQVWLTTRHYFIGKNKTPVHGVGIQPTIEVKNTKNEDLQLKKAIEVAEELLN